MSSKERKVFFHPLQRCELESKRVSVCVFKSQKEIRERESMREMAKFITGEQKMGRKSGQNFSSTRKSKVLLLKV